MSQKYLLAKENLGVLSQIAWANVLLAWDFDGTLAPISDERQAVKMRPKTLALFEKLCRLYPTAIISGRARADLLPRLGEAKVKYLVGSHGADLGRDTASMSATMRRARAALGPALAGAPGIEVEDKGVSIAVHYRRAPSKPRAREKILSVTSGLGPNVRVGLGKAVVNLVPANAPHKGDALTELRARAAVDTAFFVGDDETDEDVFALNEPGRLTSLRIGRSATSSASYFLKNQTEVDRLLSLLIHLRAA